MYLAIINVEPQDDYKLLLTFENQEKKIFDISDYLDTGKFSELKDVKLFNTVRVSFDSIAWENHLDLDPSLLYEKSIPA